MHAARSACILYINGYIFAINAISSYPCEKKIYKTNNNDDDDKMKIERVFAAALSRGATPATLKMSFSIEREY